MKLYKLSLIILLEAIKDCGEQGWWNEYQKNLGVKPLEELKKLYTELRNEFNSQPNQPFTIPTLPEIK